MLNFTASVVCDRCGIAKTTVKIEVDKLKPHPEMHLRLPSGWMVSSRPESGDLLITCPNCPPVLVSIPPSALVEDPATDRTMLAPLAPPPLPKKI